MTTLQLLTLNREIQIDESFGVSLDAQIQDVRELGEVKSSSTKPLYLRSTEEINELFGFIFNINAKTLQFDTNIKQECRLVRDGELLSEGYFQITNIDYLSKHEYIYQLVVFDEQTDFFTSIQENDISDLDFTQYNHTYDLVEIQNSWNNTADTLPYIYLLHNVQGSSYWNLVTDYRPAFYVKWLVDYIFAKYGFKYQSDFFNSDLFKELVIPFSSNDGLPTISDDEVELRKFKIEAEGECPFTFQGWSINIPDYMGNEPHDVLPHVLDDNTQTYTLPANEQVSGDSDLIKEGLCNVGILSNFGQLTYYTPKRNGKDDLHFKIEVDGLLINSTISDLIPSETPPNMVSRSHLWVIFQLRKRTSSATDTTGLNSTNNQIGARLKASAYGELVATTAVPMAVGAIDGQSTLSVNEVLSGSFLGVDVEQGAEYYVTVALSRFKMQTVTAIFRRGVDVQLSIKNGELYNEPIKIDVNEGSILKLNDFLPQNFKQKDFLRSLTKMFNLKWSPIGNRTILIEPRDEFYKKGKVLDLRGNDEFFVTTKPSKYKAVNELQNKEIVFKYKDDSDSSESQEMLERRLQKDYFDGFKEYYGQQRITFENENLKGELVVSPDFSPTIAGFNTSKETGRRYICSLIDSQNPKCNYRILFVNRLKNTGRNVINLGRALKVYNTETPDAGENFQTVYLEDLVVGTHYRKDPFEPTFDLNFGQLRKTLYPTKGTNNNLFNTFWINEIASINTAKMIVAYFYISNLEFSKLRMFDILYLEKTEYSNYFIINKILEYNAKTGEAKLELITYDPSQEFLNFPRPVLDDVPDDKVGIDTFGINTSLPDDNDIVDDSVVVGDGNTVERNSIAIGNHNTLGRNSFVQGSGNRLGDRVIAFGDENEVLEKRNVLIVGDGVQDADVEENSIYATKLISTDRGRVLYKSRISQSGTNDLAINDEYASVFDSITSTRLGVGEYELDGFENLTIKDTEVLLSTNGIAHGDSVRVQIVNNTKLSITTYSGGVASDDVLVTGSLPNYNYFLTIIRY